MVNATLPWAWKWVGTGDTGEPLDEDERTIFRSPYFEALAGIPSYDTSDSAGVDDMVEVLEPKVHVLTPEEEALYRPIYDRLVNKEKVAAEFGTHGRLASTPAQITSSLAEFHKINQKVCISFFLQCLHVLDNLTLMYVLINADRSLHLQNATTSISIFFVLILLQ